MEFSLKNKNKKKLVKKREPKWKLLPAPHLASPCLLFPLSSGNGEKLKQTLVHLLIPPPGKQAHKLSSYFLWPWGGAGWASRTRWWGVIAQCVVAIREVESGGKGQVQGVGGQGHTQKDRRRLGGRGVEEEPFMLMCSRPRAKWQYIGSRHEQEVMRVSTCMMCVNLLY